MPVTRKMEAQFQELLRMLAEMKTSQVEMKSEMLSEMKTSQVEMKYEMLSEMKTSQEEIINRQDEIKECQEQMEQRITEEIKLRQEEIKDQITAEMGNKIECVEKKIESVENKVESVQNKVEDKLLVFEKRLKSLETRPTMYLEDGAILSGPKARLLTFDGQSSWTVFNPFRTVITLCYYEILLPRPALTSLLSLIPLPQARDNTTVNRDWNVLFEFLNATRWC